MKNKKSSIFYVLLVVFNFIGLLSLINLGSDSGSSTLNYIGIGIAVLFDRILFISNSEGSENNIMPANIVTASDITVLSRGRVKNYEEAKAIAAQLNAAEYARVNAETQQAILREIEKQNNKVQNYEIPPQLYKAEYARVNAETQQAMLRELEKQNKK